MIDVSVRRRAHDARRDPLLARALARHQDAVRRQRQIHAELARHDLRVRQLRVDRDDEGRRGRGHPVLGQCGESGRDRRREQIQIVQCGCGLQRADAGNDDVAHGVRVGLSASECLVWPMGKPA